MLPALLLIAAGGVSAQSLGDSFQAARDAAQAAASRPAVILDPGALGSWFRKISSTDSVDYDGISGQGVLPQPTFDPARMHVPAAGEGDYTAGPLDSPGVYVGAHAEGREVDAGLKWDHRYGDKGQDTGQYAWRLFWRIAAPGDHSWHNPVPGSTQDVYFLPGQKFVLTFLVNPNGTARFSAAGSAAGQSASADFPLDGFWDGARRLPRRFKRVHAIDQFTTDADGKRVGDEGRPAAPTRAALGGGRWDAVVLLGARPAPLTGARAVEWRGPDTDADYAAIFPGAGPNADGGEDIVVHPPHP